MVTNIHKNYSKRICITSFVNYTLAIALRRMLESIPIVHRRGEEISREALWAVSKLHTGPGSVEVPQCDPIILKNSLKIKPNL